MKDKGLAEAVQELLEKSKRQPNRIIAMLDLQLRDCCSDESYVEYIFIPKDWCLNQYDGVHGGIISSIFDTGLGLGAAALAGKYISTTDLQVSYLRAMDGNKYVVRAEYTQVGRRMIRSIGKIYDEETGKLCATASVSFIVTQFKEKGIQV